MTRGIESADTTVKAPHSIWRVLCGWALPEALGDSRDLLQDRVRLYLKMLFLIEAGFLVLFGGGSELASPGSLFTAGYVGLALLTVVIGLCWWACRYPLPLRLLHTLEGTGTVLMSSWMVVILLPLPLHIAPGLIGALALMTFLNLRASIVPSQTGRTFTVGLLSMLPLSVNTAMSYLAAPPIADIPWQGLMYLRVPTWGLAAVATSSVTSYVIYGLQSRVREAAQLGQYTLQRKLGEGGMGIVYEATHAMLRRPTAIKLLPPERAGAHNLTRFEREVQLTAQLTHPNTVTVYDFGRTPDGVFYYAMELIDGLTLDGVVELDGAQSPARVTRVLHMIASALHEAHGVGLIHRDIKPGNVLLGSQGGELDVAKVVDFGLVKELKGGGVELTGESSLTGTPLYMSPEMIRTPEAVDARSDLYAVGAVGYFLLTGEHVFSGANLLEICGKHLHETPVPPSERLGASLPVGLERLILACLEKLPERRPASARVLCDELQALDLAAGWTETDSRAWWDKHAAALEVRRQIQSSAGDQSVQIDMQNRPQEAAGSHGCFWRKLTRPKEAS